MLELYHHGTSACAARVRLALAEKQLDWQSHYIDILRGEQFSPDYLAINPKGVVPALVDDGDVITETSVICEYLEERFSAFPLLPSDPVSRARVREWTKLVDEELHPACSALTYVISHRHSIRRHGVGSFEDFLAAGSREGRAARELKWRWIQEGVNAPGIREKLILYTGCLEKMEAALARDDWLQGDFSLADIALAPYVNRLSALALDELWQAGRLPRVATWFERLRNRPAFQTAVLDWIPGELAAEMYDNGLRARSDIRRLLAEDGTALETKES